MSLYSVYIVSKSGGMIFNYDHNYPKVENEKSYNFPLNLLLEAKNKKIIVVFGDGATAGHILLAINGNPVHGTTFDDGADILEYLKNETNFPVNLKFGRVRMTTNEKMFLGSMFYPLYAIASQISPEPKSSGIQVLDAETFRLSCLQTLTGVKFILISDPRQPPLDPLLRKIYELYSDYVLKNPFYTLEMPIRCELFDENLKMLLESVERAGIGIL